jgi:hypothetical protein
MPLVPRVMPMAAPVQREPAASPSPPVASPPAEATPVAMPDLPEGMPAHERAAVLMTMLADPKAWLRD